MPKASAVWAACQVSRKTPEPILSHESTHCRTGAVEAKDTKRMGAVPLRSVSSHFVSSWPSMSESGEKHEPPGCEVESGNGKARRRRELSTDFADYTDVGNVTPTLRRGLAPTRLSLLASRLSPIDARQSSIGNETTAKLAKNAKTTEARTGLSTDFADYTDVGNVTPTLGRGLAWKLARKRVGFVLSRARHGRNP